MEVYEIEQTISELLVKIGNYSRRGQVSEALSVATEMLAFTQEELGPNAQQTLSSLLYVSELLLKSKRHEEALESFFLTRDTASVLEEPSPSIVAYTLLGIGNCYRALNQTQEALDAYASALSVIEHSSSTLSIEQISELFHCLMEAFKEFRAQSLLRRLYKTVAQIAPELDVEKLSAFITKVTEAARWLFDHGDSESAALLFERAAETYESHGYLNSSEAISLIELAGMANHSLGDSEKGFQRLYQALDLRDHLSGKDSKEAAFTRILLAQALLEDGRTEEAESFISEALKTLGQSDELSHTVEEARALSTLGEIYTVQGNLKEAQATMEKSLGLFQELAPDASVPIARLYHNLGVIELNEQKLGEAKKNFEKAVDLRRSSLGEEHLDVAQSLWALGKCLEALGQKGQALTCYQDSLRIKEIFFEPEDPVISEVEEAIVNLQGGSFQPSSSVQSLASSFSDELESEPEEYIEKDYAEKDFESTIPEIPPLPFRKRAPAPSSFGDSQGNMAGHLMLAALVALESKQPEAAMRILRESVAILGLKRDSLETDLEKCFQAISSALEGLHPTDH